LLFSVLACGVIAPEICPGARLQAPRGAALRRLTILAQAAAIGHGQSLFSENIQFSIRHAIDARIDDTLVQCRSVPTRV
jgi:hypothetical protein